MTVVSPPRRPLIEGRGFLVTADGAAELAGVSRNVIDVWASRGDLEKAWPRPVRYWSDDVFDTQRELRRRRDRRGRFVPRTTPR